MPATPFTVDDCGRPYNFSMEPTEIEEFTKQVQEGGEANMKQVSLAISILAVLVAMVTVMGHRTHTEAVLEQARASDMWNEYQARKMRMQQVQSENHLLALFPATEGIGKQIEANKVTAEKWKEETDIDSEKAREYENGVRIAEERASRYDIGEALLQISVVLASITLLTRRYHYVIAAIVLGLAGLLTAASAFLIR